MTRTISRVMSLMGALFLCLFLGFPQVAKSAPAKDPDVEKMKLEIEKLKLENQKSQLELEKMKLKKGRNDDTGATVVGNDQKAVQLKGESLRTQRAEDAAKLATSTKDDASKLVIDFINGEIWYKGVRSNFNDFRELVKREGWKARKTVDHRDAHGYGYMKYAYQNLAALKYEHKKRGVFQWSKAEKEGDFGFVMPEGLTSDSPYDDFRNKFETPYFTYEKSKEKKGLSWLYYKHRLKFTEWDEKVRFAFDKDGHLAQFEWGVLDEN